MRGSTSRLRHDGLIAYMKIRRKLKDLDDIPIEFDEDGSRIISYEERTLENCKAVVQWFLDYKGSIRQCAAETRLSKSYIDNLIHTYIRAYFDEEYQCILRILRYNRYERSKPRKYWKGAPY